MKKIVTIIVLIGVVILFNLHSSREGAVSGQNAYPAPNSSPIANDGATHSLSYPAPQSTNSLQSPTTIPVTAAPVHVPVAVSVVLDVQIDGLEDDHSVEMELVPDIEQTEKDVLSLQSELKTFHLSNGDHQVSFRNIPAGSYKLTISAPSEYFREPQGYLFRISEDQKVELTSELPLHFKLIPPSKQQIPPCRDVSSDSNQQHASPNNNSVKECLAERIIDLSGPHKLPTISGQNTIGSGRYFYAHVYDTSVNLGVWGRMSVSDPQVSHGSENHHVVEHVYATSDYQKWIEAGWAEVNWRNNRQYIFQFDSANRTWNFYDQYSLSQGDKVTVFVQNDGGTFWRAVLYRNGVYNILARVDVGFTSVSHVFNGFENYSSNGIISIMPFSSFDEAYLYNGVLWRTWDTSFTSTSLVEVDPLFKLDMNEQFYDFYVHSPFVFLPFVMR